MARSNEGWLDIAGKAIVYNGFTIAGNGFCQAKLQRSYFPRPKERSKTMLQAMEYILLIVLVIIAWCMIYNKLTSRSEKEEL